ncbi:Putrescine aminotransferase [Desulfosarcina cetonica]|uniref:aminotransferase class III-fold pyridoxal phosphate-dependent enzyme n=1 Tax=Desulfosarcina cetonica TaxID=90730 RepID=UPI0006D12359|nr:aminotransferase class III-fold pyridoxal phosphate-dependent enzyme [Desulfosarcina cetonica]VTR70102.1 Putrescine aminotransferase [Desulfosarcina cetonica]
MRSYKDALAYSAKWLDIIKQDSASIDEATAKWISKETKENFVNHFNAGWVNYRKSMTEAGDYGAVEWRGKGARFYDHFGNEYLDFLGGYGALDLGWSHPEVVEAVRAQVLKSGIPSQELMDPLRGVLAKLLTEITPGDIDHAFFVASGTEAVEGALKIARLHTRKHSFISTVKAFHGKTSGSLSVMGKKAFRAPLQPYGAQIFFVPFGDADALERQLEICDAVGIEIAGFVAEPIQGEAGAIVPPDAYWPRVREICDRFGILMICDEVQTGLGRTGALWGVDHWNVKPDIMMAAKSLGGGVMPVGCFMGNGRIWKSLEEPNPFMHTTTTGGNPLACAAAIATIQVTLRDNLPRRAAELGDYFLCKLSVLAEGFPGIYEKITGKGLLIGQHFKDDAVGYRVAAGLFRRKVLVAGTLVNAKAIRFEPPLVVTREEIDEVLNRLEDTLKSVSKMA